MKVNYDGHEHEHELEPAYGLPEALPAHERVLWQGSPDWRDLARRVFFVRTLTIYFVAILAIRAALVLIDGGTGMAALKAVLLVAPLAVLAIGTVLGLAVMSARTTVYTITDKRVVMRLGIVLGVTFNLPFARIATAGFHDAGHGIGDITLALAGTDRIALFHLWPHARPWRLAQPEPMLRCVPEVQAVGQLLARAWSASTGVAVGVVAQSAESVQPSALARPAPAHATPSATGWVSRADSGLTQGA
jgi:hypothetical protein